MEILVINAGSSSLKYQLINMDSKNVLAKGICERIGMTDSVLKHTPGDKEKITIQESMPDHESAVKLVLENICDEQHGVIDSLNRIGAVGHRVVHGGEYFKDSVLIDQHVKAIIRQCFELAPLHNPANLAGIEACEKAMDVPMVAVFDTAFHQTMPPHAFLYPLPYALYEQDKIRRYGFHGTSHKYVAQAAAKYLDKPIDELNLVTCHLGNGSSITAIERGESVDTTMGFTPLSGLPMGTRSGDIDPAIVFYLMEKKGMSTTEVNDLLNKQSGVLGLSGVSSDFRDLNQGMFEGNLRCKLSLDMFAYRAKRYISSFIGVMGHIDAVVYAGGVGENDWGVRAGCISGLEQLGIEIDENVNFENAHVETSICDITGKNSKVKVLIIPTNEELMIALDTEKLTAK